MTHEKNALYWELQFKSPTIPVKAPEVLIIIMRYPGSLFWKHNVKFLQLCTSIRRKFNALYMKIFVSAGYQFFDTFRILPQLSSLRSIG